VYLTLCKRKNGVGKKRRKIAGRGPLQRSLGEGKENSSPYSAGRLKGRGDRRRKGNQFFCSGEGQRKEGGPLWLIRKEKEGGSHKRKNIESKWPEEEGRRTPSLLSWERKERSGKEKRDLIP